MEGNRIVVNSQDKLKAPPDGEQRGGQEKMSFFETDRQMG